MSKVFDAIRQAELHVADRKQWEPKAAADEIDVRASNSGQADTPSFAVRTPGGLVPSAHVSASPQAGIPKRDGVTLMSKVFDAIKKAELEAGERKHSGAAAAPIEQDTQAQTGGGVAAIEDNPLNVVIANPNPFARNPDGDVQHRNTAPQNATPKASSFLSGILNPETQTGGRLAWAWPWRKSRSKDPGASSLFGDLGETLESAAQSAFWQWFHLQQTRAENGVHRFQPEGSQFRSLCYLDVTVSARGRVRSVTLGIQRSFATGEHEPYARDLVRSLVCVLFPTEKSETVSRFVDELGTEFGVSRPATGTLVTRRPSHSAPSPLYLVFLGQGKRCAVELGAFLLEEANVLDKSTPWLRLRVGPAPTFRERRSTKRRS